MNKLNKTAYMLLLWAVVCLTGCSGRGSEKMYLEAKVQEDQESQEDPQDQEIQKNRTAGQTLADDNETGTQDTDSVTCFVYVCGAVKHPGVFELPKGSRIYEAIALAGGLRKDAYTKGINQAQQIQDGDMIEVLTIKEHRELEKEAVIPDDQKQQDQDGDGLVDINTASLEQLMTLNGIGEAKAGNIIAYREENGGFPAPEDIMNVDGIGEGVYAKIKDKIKVIR